MPRLVLDPSAVLALGLEDAAGARLRPRQPKGRPSAMRPSERRFDPVDEAVPVWIAPTAMRHRERFTDTVE